MNGKTSPRNGGYVGYQKIKVLVTILACGVSSFAIAGSVKIDLSRIISSSVPVEWNDAPEGF